MLRDGRFRQYRQILIQQIGWRGEGVGERVKTRLTTGQLLGITHKLKARVNCVTQHVGKVIEVQRGDVFSAVLHTQHAKSPAQWITAVVIGIDIQRGEARALWQQASIGDTVGNGSVMAL